MGYSCDGEFVCVRERMREPVFLVYVLVYVCSWWLYHVFVYLLLSSCE